MSEKKQRTILLYRFDSSRDVYLMTGPEWSMLDQNKFMVPNEISDHNLELTTAREYFPHEPYKVAVHCALSEAKAVIDEMNDARMTVTGTGTPLGDGTTLIWAYLTHEPTIGDGVYANNMWTEATVVDNR